MKKVFRRFSEVVANLRAQLLLASTILALAALGSCGAAQGGTNSLSQPGNASPAFQVTVMPETYLLGGSTGSVTAAVDQSTQVGQNQVVVKISVDQAQALKSLYITIQYDPRHYRALDAQPTELMGNPDSLLSLVLPTARGTVEYGQVLVNPDRQAGLNGSGVVAQLSFSKEPELAGRAVSTAGPPMDSASQVTNLAFDGANLTWTYFQQGDYDQNGETNISDLTPIAQHFKQVSPAGAGLPWPLTAVESQIDGDSNGEINSADIVAIGQNFKLSTLGGYEVFNSSDAGDYPAGQPPIGVNGAGTNELTIAPATPIAVSDAVNYAARITERLTFMFAVSAPVNDDSYWVRPMDGELALGIASNIQDGSVPLVPTVSSTVPANAGQGVALNIRPTATFSEAMNPATISDTTFTLRQGAISIAGSVAYTGVTATFRPDSDLSPQTIYTGTITTGAMNPAGEALASDYVWTFETGATADNTAPTVSLTTPRNGDLDVAINIRPTATFSEAMDPQTISSSTFTVSQGSAPVAGDVTYVGLAAIFTPLNPSPLGINSVYTATIKTGAKDLAGNALASDYQWTFTTGASPDMIPPLVVSTVPPDGDADVAINIKPSATFSEAMDALSITSETFTLMQGATPVTGNVTYSGVTATFQPTNPNPLGPDTEYTAKITTGAKDLAGNALAGAYEWTFTTGLSPDSIPPTLESTDPADGEVAVPVGVKPSATFSEAMDPLTISTATFTLMQGLTPIDGTVDYLDLKATFTPNASLEADTEYTATITTGAQDLAGNALTSDYVWTFTTALVDLGEVEHFGTFGGGAGMTNQGIHTVVNGDIATTGVATLITGFHDLDGDIYTETPLNSGFVNGQVFSAPPLPGTAEQLVIASQGAIDAQNAFDNLSPAQMPGGIDPGAGELGGLTLAPGIYLAAGGTFQITGMDLTLDAQGDPNAVWVFQSASSLTVGDTAPRSIILINGAQASNVYWYVGSAATINSAGGGTMVGTIIASAGVTFSTAGNEVLTILNGRAIGLNASVTLVNTIINVP